MSQPSPHLVRRGSGAPLILVHGMGVDHRLLLPLDAALEAAGGWERVYVDLPGFGGTPALPAPGGLPELADWLDGVVGEIAGEDRFALLGNSLGGLLVREVVARRPGQVAGLAMIAPVVDPDPERRDVPERVVLEKDEALLAELDEDDAAPFLEMAVIQTRPVWEGFREHVLPGVLAVDEDAVDRLEDRYALDGPLPEERFGEFDRPTLIVTGRQDDKVGWRDQLALAEHFPRLTLAMLDRTGHNAHLDQEAAVGAMVRNWAEDAAREL